MIKINIFIQNLMILNKELIQIMNRVSVNFLDKDLDRFISQLDEVDTRTT